MVTWGKTKSPKLEGVTELRCGLIDLAERYQFTPSRVSCNWYNATPNCHHFETAFAEMAAIPRPEPLSNWWGWKDEHVEEENNKLLVNK